MQADETFQVIEIAGSGTIGDKHLLDRAANIFRGVQQSAVNVEQVDGKSRNQAGCGRSPSLKPGARRPPLSGRSTCWVWSSESRGPAGMGGNCWPLMIAI